jgi:hypothetical protein
METAAHSVALHPGITAPDSFPLIQKLSGALHSGFAYPKYLEIAGLPN